jgi:hypothetical protein
MEKNILEEIFRIKSMMGINESKILLTENIYDPIVDALVRLLRKQVVLDAFVTATTTAKAAGKKIVKVGSKSIEVTNDEYNEIVKFMKNEIDFSGLTSSAKSKVRGFILELGESDIAIKKELETLYDKAYEAGVLNLLRNYGDETIGYTEKQLLAYIKQQMKKNRALDDIMGELFPDSDETIRSFLSKKISSKLVDLGDELDTMVYTGGKSVDEYLAGLSPEEINRIKGAKLTPDMIEEWANAAKKDVAFLSEFADAIRKSKEELIQEMNDLAFNFKKLTESDEFLKMTDDAKAKVMQAYTTKLAAKMNSLETKIPGIGKKMIKEGNYPPEMISFLEGAKDSDVLLYLKRFWGLRDETTQSTINIVKDHGKKIAKDLAAAYTTIFKLIAKTFFSNEGGWKKGMLARAKSSTAALDLRGNVGWYFFTDQFLSVKSFTDFAIKKSIFRPNQKNFDKFKSFAGLLGLAYVGYVFFGVIKYGIFLAEDLLKGLWNFGMEGLQNLGLESFEKAEFKMEDYEDLESSFGEILGVWLASNAIDAFVGDLSEDPTAGEVIKNMILGSLPTLGLLSYQKSMAANFIETFGLEVKGIAQDPIDIVQGIFKYFNFSSKKEEAKKELEEATGNAVPEISPEEKYNAEVEKKRLSVFNQIDKYYFRTQKEIGVFSDESEKKKLLEKIKYGGTYDEKNPSVDDTKFYIESGGKKYNIPKISDVTGKKWTSDGKEVNWETDPNLGKKLWEENYMKKLEKKIINEVLNLNKSYKNTYSNKKQNIILTENQLQNLMLRLK